MPTLIKFASALAIVIGMGAVFIALMIVSFRHSLLYWAMLSIPVLLLTAWRGRALWRWGLAFALLAVSLAASPIDFVIRSGEPSLRILPALYGITCESGFFCYGCLVPPYPARQAIVLTF
jgi:hypothetical protein